MFEDNYFNLLPFEEKRVKVLACPGPDTVRAKAHYSPYVAEVAYQGKRTEI